MKKKFKQILFILMSLTVHIIILTYIYNTDDYSRKNVDLSAVGASIFFHIYTVFDICIDCFKK
jgi:hypothetical protein